MRHSPLKVKRKIEEVIAFCETQNEPPAAYVVRRITGFTEDDLEEWRGEDAPAAAREAVKKLDEYRTYFWLRKGLDDPRWASFAVFNLKQPANGGYADKTASSGSEMVVRVKMDGVGEDAFG